MVKVRSYHVMGVMTSDMTSQMAVNVPVAGPRVSDEICHRQSLREWGLRRSLLHTLASSRTVDTLCNPTIVIHTNSDCLEDEVAADIVHGRAV
ncbi:hypothetical protein KCU77_g17980, partial [Aureobasidium melanogenum]